VAALVLAVALLAASAAVSAQTGSWTSTDVGAVTLAGSATQTDNVWTISGDGSDIWGTADSFQFLHKTSSESGAMTVRVADLQNTSPAATVIVDVKPGGGIEFMARRCAGCDMTFIGAAQFGFPVELFLSRNADGTFSASASDGNAAHRVSLGSVDVTMSNPIPGYAVTSHDPGHTARAVFTHKID